ncbi:hypothetical protein FOCC_FOCC009108 [Frankliniella occidentalis]|nr:hypothetical protein FOCC_FOCC009108 [Frankliniella occidentalis]
MPCLLQTQSYSSAGARRDDDGRHTHFGELPLPLLQILLFLHIRYIQPTTRLPVTQTRRQRHHHDGADGRGLEGRRGRRGQRQDDATGHVPGGPERQLGPAVRLRHGRRVRRHAPHQKGDGAHRLLARADRVRDHRRGVGLLAVRRLPHGTCGECTSTRHTCGFCMLGNGTGSCWPFDKDSELALGGACMTPAGADLAAGAEWAVGYCPSDYSWVAVAGLVIYLFCFAPGMGPAPWVINSEVHPLWARDVSNSISTSTNWLFNLIVSLSFLSLVDEIEAYGAFFLFSAVTFTGVVLFWFIMPETKGLTLEEIQGLFGADMEKTGATGDGSKPPHNNIQVVKTIEL